MRKLLEKDSSEILGVEKQPTEKQIVSRGKCTQINNN